MKAAPTVELWVEWKGWKMVVQMVAWLVAMTVEHLAGTMVGRKVAYLAAM